MFDLAIEMDHEPGALAALGEACGRAGVSIEGGGVFAIGNRTTAHFLFVDGEEAAKALRSAGFKVADPKRVLVQKLRQEEPGQLGKIARLMAQASVNIEVMYSDHQNQLVLVVDDVQAGERVCDAWAQSG